MYHGFLVKKIQMILLWTIQWAKKINSTSKAICFQAATISTRTQDLIAWSFNRRAFILEEVPSGSGPGQGFGIFVHIWVHSRRSAGLLPVPSRHFSKQQPSSPSGELPPQPQETPSLQAPLPPWAPPAGSAMETGRGSSDVLPHRKPQRAGSVTHCFWGEKCGGKTSSDVGFVCYFSETCFLNLCLLLSICAMQRYHLFCCQHF